MSIITAIGNFFSRVTPARRAKADIAELERDLYEARTARAIARQTFENKGLRILQLEKQIEELKADYLQVGFSGYETVRGVIEKELRSAPGFATGGFVGKDRQP